MPFELYTKLAKELNSRGFDGLLMLCGYGEPLLHHDIVNIVKQFSFTYVDIVTNGDLLTEDLTYKLVRAGVYRILISQYGNKDFSNLQKLYPQHIIVRDRREVIEGECNRGGTLSTEVNKSVCYYPFYMLQVDWNGDVYRCCHDWNRRDKLGNVSFSEIHDIWNSVKLDRVRSMLIDKGRTEEPCKNCNVDGKLRGEKNFESYLQRRLR
jgi:radical SAM protein with 4Fe4S-binding SPASM domain